MLSWVRDKLAEGRLRWQQSLQQQRTSTSPPPLPPPNAIDSPASTPIENPSGSSIDLDESSSVISQPITSISAAPQQRPDANLTLQLQETTLDNIKPNGTTIKRFSSHISRRDQG